MRKVRIDQRVVLLLAGFCVAAAAAAADDPYGPRVKASRDAVAVPELPMPVHGGDTLGRVRFWNQVAIDASGLDHTRPGPGETRVFGEQFGPTRASRAMAIVHIAMFDAANAIAGGYQSYTGLRRVHDEASIDAAIAGAAHDALAALFPSQAATFDARLAADLSGIPGGPRRARGLRVGQQAAAAILALRSGDGSQRAEPRVGIDYTFSTELGQWQQDPISLAPIALGGHWGEVRPFVLTSAAQFRCPQPPALESAEFTAAYDEAKRIGGDGAVTATERTIEQTDVGTFWAYDGTPSLCAPPRLYNQILVQIATQRHSNAFELLRLLAMANTAMADAGIAAWESKYHYNFCRPVTAIREMHDIPGIASDPTFTPLGAPASNLNGPNFTPPFPSYPSGHAAFGGALFQTLRLFYRTDRIAFTFVSDELNGVTRDNQGNVRPLLPRTFTSLAQAEEENGQSRIYLGIHWRFDKVQGIAQGRRVADYVFRHAFLPTHGDWH